jgi:predicted PurR-regulated permease PerM
MEERKYNVNISTLTIVKVLAILFLVWFLFSIKEILLLVLISIIISSAMDPLVTYLNKKYVPRAISVFLVYLMLIGVLVSIIYLLVPPISEEFRMIAESNFYENFSRQLGTYRESLNNMGVGEAIESNIRNLAGSISETLFATTRGIITGIVSLLTVFVISFYLTAEENGMKNLVKQLVPFKHQAYVNALMTKIQKKIGQWVLGQFILSLVIFVLTYVGLSILGIEFALVLALIAGLLEVIPYIGPIVALIPAVLFAFLQSPALALAVVILYIVVQQLENHIIAPLVMSRSVGLNPVLIILGVLVGGTLGGVVGVVLAVPVLSGISVFISDLWEQN